MLKQEYKSLNKNEVKKLALKLTKQIKSPQVVCFYGNLGSGKTFFCKQFISAIDPSVQDVTSPSYNIALEYKTSFLPILHVDLYRIKHKNEILDLSILEYQESHIILIEWAEHLDEYKPANSIDIFINISKSNNKLRDITIVNNTP